MATTREKRFVRESAATQPDAVTTTQTLTTDRPDLGAVGIAVIGGFGVTWLLMILGAALGFVSVDTAMSPEIGNVLMFIGWWALASALVGSFVGGVLGGRSSGVSGRVAPITHAIGAWGLTMLLTVALVALVVTTMFGATADLVGNIATPEQAGEVTEQLTQAGVSPTAAEQAVEDVFGAEATQATQDAAREIGISMWWYFGFMTAALVAGIGGWVLGSRTAPMYGRLAHARRDEAPVQHDTQTI